MIENLFISSFYSEISNIAKVCAICLILFGVISRIRRYYLTKYPFKLKFLIQKNLVSKRQKYFSKKMVIKVVSPVFPEKIKLEIIPRKKLIFEQIGIKLEKKRWCWSNEPKDIVSVKEIIDINIENEQQQYYKTHIADMYKAIKPRDNIKTFMGVDGWFVGQYSAPENCPKGGSLLLEIELYVEVKEKWKGYINFKHIRGSDYQGCARLPIEFNFIKRPSTL